MKNCLDCNHNSGCYLLVGKFNLGTGNVVKVEPIPCGNYFNPTETKR